MELMIILQKKEAHLDMIEGVVVDCLHAKWKAFIGARLSNIFYHLLIFYCKNHCFYSQFCEAVHLLPSLPRAHCGSLWPSLHRDKSCAQNFLYGFFLTFLKNYDGM